MRRRWPPAPSPGRGLQRRCGAREGSAGGVPGRCQGGRQEPASARASRGAQRRRQRGDGGPARRLPRGRGAGAAPTQHSPHLPKTTFLSGRELYLLVRERAKGNTVLLGVYPNKRVAGARCWLTGTVPTGRAPHPPVCAAPSRTSLGRVRRWQAYCKVLGILCSWVEPPRCMGAHEPPASRMGILQQHVPR